MRIIKVMMYHKILNPLLFCINCFRGELNDFSCFLKLTENSQVSFCHAKFVPVLCSSIYNLSFAVENPIQYRNEFHVVI